MTKKKLWIIGAIVLVIIGALVIGLVAGRNSESDEASVSWQEQYDLGVRYLSEGNYEEAIIAFAAAIEIDPKQVNSYIGCADAYIGLGNYEDATNILQRGYDETQNDELLIKIQDIEKTLNQTENSSTPELNEADFAVMKTLYQLMQAEDYLSIRNLVVCLDTGTLDLEKFFSEKIGGLYIFDGETFQSSKNGYGLVMIEGGLAFGSFSDGLPNGKCTILSGFQNTQTSYTLTSGEFSNGVLNGAGKENWVYHHEIEESGDLHYNAKEFVCNTWIDDVAVGNVEITTYGTNYSNDILTYFITTDYIQTGTDGMFLEGYSKCIRNDSVDSSPQEGDISDVRAAEYSYAIEINGSCFDQFSNNGYFSWKDSEGNWIE